MLYGVRLADGVMVAASPDRSVQAAKTRTANSLLPRKGHERGPSGDPPSNLRVIDFKYRAEAPAGGMSHDEAILAFVAWEFLLEVARVMPTGRQPRRQAIHWVGQRGPTQLYAVRRPADEVWAAR